MHGKYVCMGGIGVVWGQWGVVNRIKNSIIIRNQSLAAANSTEYLVETDVAVWLVLLLLERSLIQLLQAEGTDEVFRMEFLEHGRNATSGDRF